MQELWSSSFGFGAGRISDVRFMAKGAAADIAVMTRSPVPFLSFAGLTLALLAVSPASMAQISKANVRAVNMARMRAETINGGLSNYRAAKCMYATGDGGGPCLKGTSEGFLFVFEGGAPGWQESGQPASVETEILISSDGRTVLSEIYNGEPR